MKKRFDNLDLLKAIAIVMVISLHVGLLKTNFMKEETINRVVSYALRLICEGVPIFIFVNGFLLINKEKFSLKQHLIKTAKIFSIMIIWSIIYIIGTKIILGENLQYKDLFLQVLKTDIKNKYTGILWFLQNLIALYLIYPVIKNLHDTNKKTYNYFFIIVAIFTVGINFLSLIIQMINAFIGLNNLNMITVFINKFAFVQNGFFLFFFMLGGYIGEYKEIFNNKKKRRIATIAGILAWILAFGYAYMMSKKSGKLYPNSYNCNSIFMVFTIIGWYAITFLYKNKDKWYNKMIQSIGKNSLGIYLVHKLIITIISKKILIQGDYSIQIRTLETISVLLISWVITIIIKKIPILKKVLEI